MQMVDVLEQVIMILMLVLKTTKELYKLLP